MAKKDFQVLEIEYAGFPMEVQGTFLKGTPGDYNTPPEPNHFHIEKVSKIDGDLGNEDITRILNQYEMMDISNICLTQIGR